MIDRIRRLRKRSYRYSLIRGLTLRRSVSALLAIVLVIGSLSTLVQLVRTNGIADAASGSATGLYPSDDFDPGGPENNWAETGGTATNDGVCTNNSEHCNRIDDNDTGSSTYIGTGTGMDGTTAVEEFDIENFTVSGTFTQITEVTVYLDAVRSGACLGNSSNCDDLTVDVYTNGAEVGSTWTITGSTASPANGLLTTTSTEHSNTWSGLTSTNQNDLRIEITRVVNGGGPASGRDDNVRISELRVDVTYDFIPDPPLLTQEDYIFENDDLSPASEDDNFGSTFANDTGIGTEAWTNPSNADADDASIASVQLFEDDQSNYLKATNFGFSIPTGVLITGIEVDVEMHSTVSNEIYDNAVRIVKGGVISTTDRKRAPSITWPTTFSVITYGSDNDLWGESWSPSDINATNFGFVISAYGTCPACSAYAEIDYISITVHYKYDGTAQAGSQFSSPKTLDTVNVGETTNLRMHLKNTGGALTEDTDLGLFYDRNDNIWTKVGPANTKLNTAAGDCSDTKYECTTIETSDTIRGAEDMAINPITGFPMIVYYDVTNSFSVGVAQYVGSDGTGCNSTSEWSCSTVHNPSNAVGQQSSIAFDKAGKAYIAFREDSANTVNIAEYVGSGGDCTNTAWECTAIETLSSIFGYSDITIDGNGNPAIAYQSGTTDNALSVARYVGSGGSNCDISSWDCELVEDAGTDDAGQEVSIGANDGNQLIVAHYNNTSNQLEYAVRDGGNSGCDDADWTCEVIRTDDNAGRYPSIALLPNGNPLIGYLNSTDSSLEIAERTGSGSETSCGTGGSSNWDCVVAHDPSGSGTLYTEMAISPSGDAVVAFQDSNSDNLHVARYIGGTGGDCTNTAWACDEVDTSTTLSNDTIGLGIGPTGDYWIAYTDEQPGFGGSDDLYAARLTRAGEIVSAPSQGYINDDPLSESHADMTSATDTSNRDSADCVSGSTTWNDGKYFGAPVGNAAIADGETTAQCTEVMWTLDTSQATPGETYRFIVATSDSLDPDQSPWRGPATIDEYPKLTISNGTNQTVRFSKDSAPTFADCTDTDWGCEAIAEVGTTTDGKTGLAFSPDGTPYVSIYNATATSLMLAQYVGSGGSGCGAGGSSSWTCTTVDDDTDDTGRNSSLAFSPDGTPYIIYTDWTAKSIMVAHYIGGGNGSGCGASGSSDWVCTTVDANTIDNGRGTGDIAINSNGTPYISYYRPDIDALAFAYYVGGGNGSGCGASGSDDWVCTTVDDHAANNTGLQNKIAISPDGTPYISYYYEDISGLMLAQYVGSGGSGCGTLGSSAWTCTTVDNDTDITGSTSDIAFSPDGTTYISYLDSTATSLMVAEYVGGGTGSGCGASGSSDWTCTIVDNDTDNTGSTSDIAFSPDGTPYISYSDTTATSLKITQYVGSGGSGCGASGSSAWTCTTVDNTGTNSGSNTRMAFDKSGRPWVSNHDSSADTIRIAVLDLPSEKLDPTSSNTLGEGNAGSSDYRYHISAGRSDYNENDSNCNGNSNYSGYCGLGVNDGDSESLVAASADEIPLFGMAARYDTNTVMPWLHWTGTTNLAPSVTSPAASSGDLKLQIYNYNTSVWDDVVTDSASTDCTSGCTLSGMPTGTPSHYYSGSAGDWWISVRLYQVPDGTTTITMRTEAFKATQQSSTIRHGSFFRNGRDLPLNQRR